MVRIDEALALAKETEQRQSDVYLQRIRGEILLKVDPAKAKSAEESSLASIAIAQQQEARTEQLLAALALAKLYRATGRTAEARAVLAPALEGFTATPELPEIAEAQTLSTCFPQNYSPMISPNGTQRLPSNFSSCNWLKPR